MTEPDGSRYGCESRIADDVALALPVYLIAFAAVTILTVLHFAAGGAQ